MNVKLHRAFVTTDSRFLVHMRENSFVVLDRLFSRWLSSAGEHVERPASMTNLQEAKSAIACRLEAEESGP